MFEKINKFKKKIVLRDYIVLAVLSVLFIIALYFYKYYTLTNQYKTSINQIAKEQSLVFHTEFENIRSDIEYFLSATLVDGLRNTNNESKIELTHAFYYFMKIKSKYDQLRVLDKNGQEFIRIDNVDGLLKVVDKEDLQDKSDRYYFKESRKLGLHEIYISKLDLNIEHGNIETPIKPMIRFVRPIYDREFNFHGVIVFNYKAETLLSKLKNIAKKQNIDMYMVNQVGHIIENPNFNYNWSFMYDDSKMKYLQQTNENIWKLIKDKEKLEGNGKEEETNLIEDTIGMYKISDYYPYRLLLQKANHIQSDEKKEWYLVLGKNKSSINEIITHDVFTTIPYILSVFIVGLILVSLLTKYRYRLKLKEDRRKISTLTVSKTSKAIFVCDKKQRVADVNSSFLKVTGYELKDVLGKNLSNFIGNFEDDKSIDKIIESLESLDSWEGIIWNQTKDKVLYPALFNFDVIRDHDSKIEHYIIMFSDLTDEINKKKSIELQNEYVSGSAQTKKFLHKTVDFDKSTNTSLISPLAQLIVNIADEVDLPLSMIRNSSFVMHNALESSLSQIFQFASVLDDEQKKAFKEILTQDIDFEHKTCFLNPDQMKQDLVLQLQNNGIQNSQEVVEILFQANLVDKIDKVLPFVDMKYQNEFLSILNIMHNIWINISNIELAVSKASKVIESLENSLHKNINKLSYSHIGRSVDNVLTIYQGQIERDVQIIKEYGIYDEILCYSEELQKVWSFIVKKLLYAMNYKGQIDIFIEENNEYQIVNFHYNGDIDKNEEVNSSLEYSGIEEIINKHHGKIEIETTEQNGITYKVYIDKNLDKKLLEK